MWPDTSGAATHPHPHPRARLVCCSAPCIWQLDSKFPLFASLARSSIFPAEFEALQAACVALKHDCAKIGSTARAVASRFAAVVLSPAEVGLCY